MGFNHGWVVPAEWDRGKEGAASKLVEERINKANLPAASFCSALSNEKQCFKTNLDSFWSRMQKAQELSRLLRGLQTWFSCLKCCFQLYPLLHGGELLLLEVWETLEKPEKAVLLV